MIKRVLKGLAALIKDEEGQSTTEYILILAVVVLIALKFKEKIGQQIESATDQIGSNIDKALQQ